MDILTEAQIVKLYEEGILNVCLQECQYFNLQFAFEDEEKYKIVKLYQLLCHFELDQIQESVKLMDQMIENRKQNSPNKIEKLDLIFYSFYLWKMFEIETYETEENNSNLLQLIEEYKQSISREELSFDGVYPLALGIYKFIDTYRDASDLECVKLVNSCLILNGAPWFKQEIQKIICWMNFKKEKYEISLKQHLEFFQKYPKYPGQLNNIGQVYEKLNDFTKAHEFYLRHHVTKPLHIGCIVNLAAVNLKLRKDEQVGDYLKLAYLINPNSARSALNYGKYLLQRERVKEGLEILNKYMQYNPKFSETYLVFAQYHENAQEYNQQKFYLEKLLEIEPKNGYYHNLYAKHLYLYQDNCEESLEHLMKSINLKLKRSQIQSIYTNISNCLYELQRFEESLEYNIKSLDFDFIFDFSLELEHICETLNNELTIPLLTKIDIFNNQYGPFLTRLPSIILNLQNQTLKVAFSQKFNYYQQTLQIIAYQKFVQPQLTFQNEISHWDLFIN